MENSNINPKGAIEAILFASGEPIDLLRISDAIGETSEDTLFLIMELKNEYENRQCGINIIRVSETLFQMTTNPNYAQNVRSVFNFKAKQPLSQSLLEVLSIIAYKQPITKVEIAQIRGVDSSFAVNSLVQKELVEEKGRFDAPGKPILFGTTTKFLRSFGIESIEELDTGDEK